METGSVKRSVSVELGALFSRFAELGFAWVDEGGRIGLANGRWRELCGAVPGASWLAGVSAEECERVAAGWRRAAARAESASFTFRAAHPTGAARRLRAEFVPYGASDDGSTGWVAALALDARDGRADDEELFRQLTLNIREVFWLTDWRRQELLFVSPVYETVWGRSCRSLYEDPASWAEPIHPEDRDRAVTAFRRRAELGTYAEEYRVLWPDGSVRWIYDRAFPIRDEEGRVVRMAGLSEDVTDRRRSERELAKARDELELRVNERTRRLRETSQRLRQEARERETAERELRAGEQRFRELAESIQEVFWLTAADLEQLLYVSPAYERIWGRTVRSLHESPRDWLEAVVPEERDAVRERYYADVLHGRYDVEYRIRRPDGTLRWIHDRGFAVRDESGAVVRIAGVAMDVTERKEAELTMQAYQERLRSMAMELVLAEERERRSLAVDLHDGLSQLVNLAQMKLVSLRAATSELAQPLAEITALVDQASRAARSLTFQLSPPVLHDFGLEAAVQWLAEELQRAHGLEVSVHAGADPVPLDEKLRTLLFRAVRELLINVTKHAAASRADVRIRHRGARVEVEVADDGRGIAPGGEFQQGFGLFSVRERLSQLGGSMRIGPGSGTGTKVTLECPLSFEGAADAGSSAETQETSP